MLSNALLMSLPLLECLLRLIAHSNIEIFLDRPLKMEMCTGNIKVEKDFFPKSNIHYNPSKIIK